MSPRMIALRKRTTNIEYDNQAVLCLATVAYDIVPFSWRRRHKVAGLPETSQRSKFLERE
jgi:hypothetical protein